MSHKIILSFQSIPRLPLCTCSLISENSHFYLLPFFIRENERDGGTNRDLPSTGLFPKCARQLRLGQAKTLSLWMVGTHILEPSSIACKGAPLWKAQLEIELGPKSRHSTMGRNNEKIISLSENSSPRDEMRNAKEQTDIWKNMRELHFRIQTGALRGKILINNVKFCQQ